MRIAHVTATFPPYRAGTGNVAYHNARVLHERGHEVVVFTATARSDARAAGDAGGAAGEAAGGAGFFATPFETRRLPAALRLGNAPLTPALWNALGGFDLVHLHYPYIFGAELAVAAARRAGAPLVVTYHNRLQETQPVKRALFGAYNRLSEPAVLASAARVFAVTSEHLASLHPELERSGRAAEVPNGVDAERFRPDPAGAAAARSRLGTPEGAPVALFVGALDPAHRFKNVDGLLRAFAAARSRLPADAELWIVGDGELRPGLERLARGLGLDGRARFLGGFGPDDLPPLYGAADLTVLPSTSVESFGLVLIESLACGTAALASSLPGVRTVVDEGIDGALVPPGDDGALADALAALLRDRAALASMGANGRARVERVYDWPVVGRILESRYEEVLASWS